MECLSEKSKDKAEKIEQLKCEWKRLWKDRFDDKVLAEGVASQDYSSLSVERGTVIFASRNFKPITLKGILEQQGVTDVSTIIQPNPQEGGWRKFIKNNAAFKSTHRRTRRAAEYSHDNENKQLQQRKGGRGWLHQ
jgi:hypothetical protein